MAGDLAALSAIAHNLLGRVEQDDERRARQADKKRKQRGGTSRMSPDVPGRPGTSGDVPGPVPTPTKILTTTPPPAAQVIAKLGDEKLQRGLDQVAAMMGEKWIHVAEFLLRRKYSTWQGWVDAFNRDVGMTSQFSPDDLAKVCQDDATLDDKIGSGWVLRKFLGPARQDRLEGARSPPGADRPSTAKPGAGRRASPKPSPQKFDYPEASDPEKEIKWAP